MKFDVNRPYGENLGDTQCTKARTSSSAVTVGGTQSLTCGAGPMWQWLQAPLAVPQRISFPKARGKN